MQSAGTLRVGAMPEGSMVEVTIQDSGQGIPKERLTQIFEPLVLHKGQGDRLGLSISRDIVDRRHGTLTVISELGVERTFTVLLPAAA